MKEPRGHSDMFGAVLVESKMKEADIGVFYMENKGYLDMCGHATIGIVTALIETGRIEANTLITLETPAGLVKAWPNIKNGKVEKVTLQNVDSFVYGETSLKIDMEEGKREISADIVYSGNTIALVDVDKLGIRLEKKNLDKLIKYGLQIKDRLNDLLNLENDITNEKNKVDITEFYKTREGMPDKNVVVFADGSVDRSPCGTGTCAKMTLLYSEGKLDLNEKYEYESIIGTLFEGKIAGVEEKNGLMVVKNRVTGSAYITGEHTFYLDPEDTLTGFSL
ncbi:MAG: proline racemase family protein [Thermoplasmatota archaeon]